MMSEIIFSTQGNKALLYFDPREINNNNAFSMPEKRTISTIIF